MLLDKVICNTDVKETLNYENVEIKTLAHDSRKVTEGTLFFCIRGTKVDGHEYAAAAQEAGAAALVVEEFCRGVKIPQVLVCDTRAAMSTMAAQFYGNPANRLRIIGVTGTNGKTSVTYMIKSIAAVAGYRCGIIGTIGIVYSDHTEPNNMTTPDPIELQSILSKMVEDKMHWVVMEVTAHALDLRKLCGITFDVAAFTNLTQDHLDYFGDLENYFRAKSSFFTKKLSRLGIINEDDAYGKRILASADIPCLSYGIESKRAPIRAENVVLEPSASSFDLIVPHGAVPVKLKVGGRFNIYNALAAAGCAMLAGASFR
ncbi:MAG TPA: UDP-N-acetylmuramyl-tripeptide synthetase, partial [Clostridia bacterium]|nr:UDP-N-acetylmuramyl-tripeptide synthetase [Clostridia bacterium]